MEKDGNNSVSIEHKEGINILDLIISHMVPRGQMYSNFCSFSYLILSRYENPWADEMTITTCQKTMQNNSQCRSDM